jgi:hypothetical protein
MIEKRVQTIMLPCLTIPIKAFIIRVCTKIIRIEIFTFIAIVGDRVWLIAHRIQQVTTVCAIDRIVCHLNKTFCFELILLEQTGTDRAKLIVVQQELVDGLVYQIKCTIANHAYLIE